MATIYGSRHTRPLGVSRHGFGGAGLNLGVESLAGETDLITTFDDFNHVATNAVAGAGQPGVGWTSSAVGAVAAEASGINDRAQAQFESSLLVNAGTAADTGLNLQLVGADAVDFPHIWYADDAPAVSMDNTVFVFACRIGLINNTAATWDGKAFIGFANNPDVNVMTAASGVLTVPSANGLLGFHIPEDGSIDFVSQRLAATALVAETNFTEIFPAGTVVNATANEPTWFDLAFRMHITDMSDNANNGEVRCYFRRVPGVGDDFGVVGAVAAGLRETQASDSGRVTQDGWREHGTVLLNQNPNPANATGVLVPTIEVLNGGGAPDTDMLVDWWSMGISRFSRRFI
jgi:hypothetical protein